MHYLKQDNSKDVRVQWQRSNLMWSAYTSRCFIAGDEQKILFLVIWLKAMMFIGDTGYFGFFKLYLGFSWSLL